MAKTANKTAEVKTAVARNININKVVVTGRLTGNTENVKLKEKNRYVCKGSVAINRTYKGEEYVSFVDFEMFTDNPIELKKGQKVYIEGRVVSDEWENDKGEFRSKTKIQAFSIIPTEISGNDMNVVMISGRLVKDPVVVTIKEGRSAVKFRLAVNRNYQVDNEWKQVTEYIEVSHFGTTEYIAKLAAHLAKGKFVYITGSLLQERWTTENGENRSRVSVVAETINLSYVNSKKSEETTTENTEKNVKENEKNLKKSKKTKAKKKEISKPEVEVEVEDIENEIEDIEELEDIETPF